ncbi:hypothetical protein [uncultured Desulfobacter sp.]|uniref:hypothetical protein n=1 Tax=uncultured Desulfobacter sp. TaxID=240139 RepID=UPI0029F4A8AE|nr:hypothetical protein [uncultured Desulfobacter sp.]
MSEKIFYEAFKGNMDLMGLPCPKSIFGTVTLAVSNISVLAGGIKTLGAGATMSEIFLTIPTAGGATALATAVGEICLVVGGLAAAFYVGACLGSLIVAVIETQGVRAAVALRRWADQISRDIGMTIDQLLTTTVQQYPLSSSMRPAVNMAKAYFA